MNQFEINPFSNIIILVDRYDSIGGIQQWANQVANKFQDRNSQVYLIGLTRPAMDKVIKYNRDPKIKTITLLESKQHQAYSGRMGKLRLKVARLPSPVRHKIDYLIKGWRPHKVNEAIVDKLQIEMKRIEGKSIIIATSQTMLDYLHATSLKVGRGTSTPLIAQYHNDFRLVAEKYKSLKQFKRSYANADRILFLTESNRSLARASGIEATGVIPNPIPTVSDNMLITKKKKIAVALGRLVPEKSFDSMIRSWKEVKQKYPDWQLHIYGSGHQEKRLQLLIERLDLTDVVTLKGITQEPLEILSEASLHLISSQNEGWALTISEAAAVKTPTISFDSGPGIRAQITSGVNGIIVEKNNSKMYSQAIIDVISNPQLLERMGENALENSAQFSIENIVEQWLQLFQDISR